MQIQVNRSRRLWLAALLTVTAGLSNAAEPPQLILFHGRILSVDSHDSVVEALAIRDGTIVAVWDADMYSVPAEQLRDLKCTMTLFHGRVVFDSHHP